MKSIYQHGEERVYGRLQSGLGVLRESHSSGKNRRHCRSNWPGQKRSGKGHEPVEEGRKDRLSETLLLGNQEVTEVSSSAVRQGSFVLSGHAILLTTIQLYVAGIGKLL